MSWCSTSTSPAWSIQRRKEPNLCRVPHPFFHTLIFASRAFMPDGMTQRFVRDKKHHHTYTRWLSVKRVFCLWLKNKRPLMLLTWSITIPFLKKIFVHLLCYKSDTESIHPGASAVNNIYPFTRHVCWSFEKVKQRHSCNSSALLNPASGFRGRWRWTHFTCISEASIFSLPITDSHNPSPTGAEEQHSFSYSPVTRLVWA